MNKWWMAAGALLALLLTAPRPATEANASIVLVDWRDEFAVQLLERLGKPVTQQNVDVIWEWTMAEDSGDGARMRNNPLNTTQNTAAVVGSINSVGVKAYATWEDGLQATVETLTNGHYDAILAALTASDPEALRQAIWASPWSGESHYGYGAHWPRRRASDSEEALRQALVATALSQVGKPYLLGAAPKQGDDPKNFDCSSFVQWVYWRNGIELTRTTYTQLNEGLQVIEAQDLLPGDLIYQQWPTDQHVLMWIGDHNGNGTGDAINAGGYRQDVNVIDDFFGDELMVAHVIGYRRVIGGR